MVASAGSRPAKNTEPNTMAEALAYSMKS